METGGRVTAAVEFANQTQLHPVGLAAFLVLAFAMFSLPRRYALVPVFVLGCMVPTAQRVAIMSLDFDLLRLMVIVGWLRVLSKQENAGFQWRTLDYFMIAWALVGMLTYTVQQGTMSAMIKRAGDSFDVIGMYFLFRSLIRTWDDLLGALKALMVIGIPVSAAFVFEHFTRHNPFALFGGVPGITMIREGRLRCQGAFSHPILAGCFWASLVPMFVACYWQREVSKSLVIAGTGAALVTIVMCASSTPVMGILFACLGATLLPLRRQMRVIRWGFLGLLVCLHMMMKAPVWHLITRVDVVSGSTGYHRFALLDAAIRNFSEWCAVGIKGTGHWGWGLQDVTNQYILEGVTGGIMPLILFVITIGLAFGSAGRLWRAWEHDRTKLLLAWGVGIAIFVHCCNFMAVTYFGQISILWYFCLAAVTTLAPVRGAVPATSHAPAVPAAPAIPAFRQSADAAGAFPYGRRPVRNVR